MIASSKRHGVDAFNAEPRSAPAHSIPDRLADAKICPVPGAGRERLKMFLDLQAMRRILRDGCEGHLVEPFKFWSSNGALQVAENSGLEGFLFSRAKFEQRYGKTESIQHTKDYFSYCLTILEGESLGRKLANNIRALYSRPGSLQEKHDALLTMVEESVERWRDDVFNLDAARWSRHLRARQVFIRAEDVTGHRKVYGNNSPEDTPASPFFAALRKDDFQALYDHSFSAQRLLGTYPIGTTNAKGTGGGSPYSITAHKMDPAHGSAQDANRALKTAYEQGLLSIFEVVPNHTSCDSELLKSNPNLFVHCRTAPADPRGYLYFQHPEHGEYWIRHGGYRDLGTGKRDFWVDTLQLDFSRSDTREYVITEICDLIRKHSLDGIRIDSAYQLLNRYLAQNWEGEMFNKELPKTEFLAELICRVKTEFPHVAVIAEAFTDFDAIAESGADLVYGVNSMELRGGARHAGWHEALKKRDPQHIWAAIERAEFLNWQIGGPDIITFFGNQDLPSPADDFGETWKYGAAVLTLLRPGAFSYYAGSESSFKDPCDEDKKVLSFNRPNKIDYTGASAGFGKFQMSLLKAAAHIRDALGDYTSMRAIPVDDSERSKGWVGYFIDAPEYQKSSWRLAVVVNTADSQQVASFKDPATGRYVRVELAPAGPDGYALIQLDTTPATAVTSGPLGSVLPTNLDFPRASAETAAR
jgi:glycosidase